jgi:DNA-binding GntR family transcriptional regulator
VSLPRHGRVMLGTQVYESLRGEIIRGVITPGESLLEKEIAARFGVSRTPTREALRRLESEGLAHRHGPGLIAVPFSLDAGTEVLLIRRLLEPACGAASAPRLGAFDLVRLDSIVAEMDDAWDTATPIEQAELNNLFHETLYARCPYPRLLDEVRRIREHYVTFWLYETYTTSDRRRVVDEHRRLLAMARDIATSGAAPDRLSAALDEHLQQARRRFEANVHARGLV